MADNNKVLKKLRNGPVIEVDPQILRWRQKMRRREIALGKATARQKRENEYQAEMRALNGDISKKKFY